MELEELLQHPVVKPLVEKSTTARFAVEQCYNCKYFTLKLQPPTKNGGAIIGSCSNSEGTPTKTCSQKKLRWDMRDDINIPEE